MRAAEADSERALIAARAREREKVPSERDDSTAVKKKQLRRRVGSLGLEGMLVDEGFQQSDNLLLLAAWQLGRSFKSLPEFSSRNRDTTGLWFAQNFLNADSENPSHGKQELGFGDLAGALPIKNGGVIGAELSGQLTDGQSGVFAQAGEMGGGIRLFWQHGGNIHPTGGNHLRTVEKSTKLKK